jgi:hypothetical protein
MDSEKTTQPGTRTEALDAAPMWRRAGAWYAWWPALLPPLVLVAVYVAEAVGWGEAVGKGWQETLAPYIMIVAVAVYGVRWAMRCERFHLVLGALSVAFLCREIHFQGTHRGVYLALALIAAWCLAWRTSLVGGLRAHPRRARWLVLAGWAYLMAFIVQRRALRFLPSESDLHVQMEEVGENVAHVFLIVLGLV